MSPAAGQSTIQAGNPLPQRFWYHTQAAPWGWRPPLSTIRRLSIDG
jgi:hypothetical protein